MSDPTSPGAIPVAEVIEEGVVRVSPDAA